MTRLDDNLKEWAAAREPSEAQQEALRARIRERAVEERIQSPVLVPGHVSFAAKLRYAALGATVALLVGLAYDGLTRTGGPGAPSNGTIMDYAMIPEARRETGLRLFEEMDRIFEDRLRWVAESNGDVGMGVESIPGGLSKEAVPVLVRVTVVSRKSGEKVWHPAWSTDVMLRGQEVVEIVPNKHTANKLALWVYPLADGKIAVDGNVALTAPMRMSCKVDAVVQRGVPLELMSVQDGETEYRVFQTVTDLTGKGEV